MSTNAQVIQPGTAEWWRQHVHEMPAKRLNSERALWGTVLEVAAISNAERAEIKAVLEIIEKRLDEITPTKAAQIDDHDRLTGYRSSSNWPTYLHANTLQMHWHWCELLEAWNLNPFKRQESFGTATVDESAEAEGITRFVFPSRENRNDFLEAYNLEDFIRHLYDPHSEGDVFALVLVNNFDKVDAAEFLNILKHATNQLAIIHDERMRAIRNDGGRIGFITADHFNKREAHEMTRITQARNMLGAKYLAE